MVRVNWVWASPPDEALRGVARCLEAGELPAALELVKSNSARSVWRLPDVSGGLIVKRFQVGRGEGWLFNVRPSRARREYQVMADFCRRGLPTVRPMAFGERWQGGRLLEAWFFGRLVADSRTLAEQLNDVVETEGLSWMERGLDVISEMHQHPYVHRDLHVGNLLVGPDQRILIMDLHSVWRVPRLTYGMRVRNLAEFLFSARRWVSLDDAPILLRSYAECQGLEWSRLVADVERATESYERDHVRGRSARCVRKSSQFVVERNAGAQIFRQRVYPLDALLNDQRPDGDYQTLGDAPRSLVRLVGGQAGQRVVKTYRSRGVRSILRQSLGWGRGRSAWMGARRLTVLGIPTPEGLALVEHRDGSAVLVTRSLRDAEPLREFVQSLKDSSRAEERRQVALAVGHLLGRLARTGVQHHDLSTKNMMITEGDAVPVKDMRSSTSGHGPTLHLIDLDNLRLTRPYSASALVRMLGQLGDLPEWVTRSDRARFCKGFKETAGRVLAPDVIKRAQQRTLLRQRRRALRSTT